MKSVLKILFGFLFFSVLLIVPSVVDAQEVISDFESHININQNGTIDVVEKITYDFGSEQRHGIFRFIPTVKTNQDGKKFALGISNIVVRNAESQAYTYTQEKKGDDVYLKIGNANTFVTGEQIYIISYQVSGALTYFSDHDELYWNVTGNGWDAAIEKAHVLVALPFDIEDQAVKSVCFTGAQGSDATQCASQIVEKNSVEVATTQVLQPKEGLTFAVRFPKGQVAVLEPKPVVNFFDTWLGKIAIVLILLTVIGWYLLLPIWIVIRWIKYGRDPRSARTKVTAWYDPPKSASGRELTPAEVGTLVDEYVNVQEISSVMIRLAQKGLILIHQKDDKTFELHKKREVLAADKLMPFEEDFLKTIFGASQKASLDTAKASDAAKKIQNELYEHMVKEGFFPDNPQSIRTKYMILAGAGAFTFNFFLLIVAGIFGWIMPRKTLQGAQAADVANGMKSFLTSQERQLAFQAKEQMMFEKLLPFAVAFGVEKIWADRFKDVMLQNPEWFEGTNPGSIRTFAFGRAVQSSFASYQSSTRSSSGFSSGFSGGSSGGGGGGGGGGSW